MKKGYVKPEIVYTDFQLSANIASCGHGHFEEDEGKANFASAAECSFEFYNIGSAFMDAVNGCDFTPQDDIFESFCYHSALLPQLFNS